MYGCYKTLWSILWCALRTSGIIGSYMLSKMMMVITLQSTMSGTETSLLTLSWLNWETLMLQTCGFSRIAPQVTYCVMQLLYWKNYMTKNEFHEMDLLMSTSFVRFIMSKPIKQKQLSIKKPIFDAFLPKYNKIEPADTPHTHQHKPQIICKH